MFIFSLLIPYKLLKIFTNSKKDNALSQFYCRFYLLFINLGLLTIVEKHRGIRSCLTFFTTITLSAPCFIINLKFFKIYLCKITYKMLMFFFEVCSTPPTRYGLTYIIEIPRIPDKWADGDEISYHCTGSGEISGTVTNECQDNGQWSLTSLPLCCKLN